jgi:SAM-dependent methyltransferase
VDTKSHWEKKHIKYSQQDWITKPTIFATQVITYFPKTGKILDLGAGQGQDSVYFANHGYQVLASDFSEYSLSKIADTRIKKQLVDLSRPLPFFPDSLDIIYSHMSLHYFKQARTKHLFDEIFTVLKPGGVFATLTNSLDDPDISSSIFIEDDYYESGGIPKRYFSTQTLARFTSKFETLLLDSHGETYKDSIKTLIRFIGRKPTT